MTNQYMPILDDRRLDDELAEARRILNYYRLMFVSGNDNPVRQRLIEATDIVVRDTQAFFETFKAVCKCRCGCRAEGSTEPLCSVCLVREGRGHDCGRPEEKT